MKPHLLFLSDIPPWPSPLFGAQLRTARLVAQLSRSFEVTLLCSNDPGGRPSALPGSDRIDAVPRSAPARDYRWGDVMDTLVGLFPASVHAHVRGLIPRALLPALHELKQTNPPVAVWAYHSFMAELARTAGLPNIVVDIDDFEHVVWGKDIRARGRYRRAGLHRLSCAGLQRYEQRLGCRFPALAVSKEEDLAHIRQSGVRSRSIMAVIPNGIDLPTEIAPLPSAPTLLFVGLLAWPPNSDAIRWFIDQVFPRILDGIPEARVIIAGRGPIPPELAPYVGRRGVHFEVSPRDIADVYRDARVAIAPVRLGDGTKIKVLEALAMGRPVVTTNDAARGHAIIDGVHAIFANEPADFATGCLQLLRDDALAATLARAGRDWVESHGSWTRSGDAAISLVAQMLEEA